MLDSFGVQVLFRVLDESERGGRIRGSFISGDNEERDNRPGEWRGRGR